MTLKKTLQKDRVCMTSSVIWWQSVYPNESCEIFQRCVFEKWNSLKEVTNTPLTAFQERPHTASQQPLAGPQHRCDNQGPCFWKVFLFCLPPSFQSSLEFPSYESPIVWVSPGSPTPCRGRNVNLLGLALSLNLIQQVTKPHLSRAPKFYHNSLSAQPHISSGAVRRRLVMKPIYPHFLNWHT